jgi:DNA-directed RNA polymerase subunit RPC12/RpoP
MMIRFKCTKCSHRLKAREQYAGRRVRCTRCRTTMRVPAPSEAAAHRVIRRAPESAEELPAIRIRFLCLACGKPVGAESRIGGRWAKCPHCGKIVDVPSEILAAVAEEPVPTGAPSEPHITPAAAPAPAAVQPTPARESDEFLAQFLPPHYEVLPELDDFGVPELKAPEDETEDYVQPVAEGGYGFRLVLHPRKRPLYILIALLLLLYAGLNGWRGVRRFQAAGQLAAGDAPAWLQSLTPPPPRLAAQQAEAAEGRPRIPPLWAAFMGLAIVLLGFGQIVGAWLLLQQLDVAARWVFIVAIVGILIEFLDLSITGTGFMTVFKPAFWAVGVLSIIGVVSR